MPGWIATGIAAAALVFSFWTWWRQRKYIQKRDRAAGVDRVAAALVEVSGTAANAAQGSPHHMNQLKAARQGLANAIAAAGIDMPACRAVADAPGPVQVGGSEDAAFREVQEALTHARTA